MEQFMMRLPQRAVDRLAEIALERGFVGGRGSHGQGNPNKAEAARWLLGQADSKLFDILYGEEAQVGA